MQRSNSLLRVVTKSIVSSTLNDLGIDKVQIKLFLGKHRQAPLAYPLSHALVSPHVKIAENMIEKCPFVNDVALILPKLLLQLPKE